MRPRRAATAPIVTAMPRPGSSAPCAITFEPNRVTSRLLISDTDEEADRQRGQRQSGFERAEVQRVLQCHRVDEHEAAEAGEERHPQRQALAHGRHPHDRRRQQRHPARSLRPALHQDERGAGER